jgi:hypothetical protein
MNTQNLETSPNVVYCICTCFVVLSVDLHKFLCEIYNYYDNRVMIDSDFFDLIITIATITIRIISIIIIIPIRVVCMH